MNTECDSAKHFQFNTFEKMDSDEELDLMLLAVLLIKKQNRRKRKIWVKEIYKCRKTFGIDGLVREMQLTSREAYFK